MLSRAYPLLLCDLACVLADYPVAMLPDDEVPEFILSEGLEGYQEITEHIKCYINWNILLAKWGLLQGGLLQIMWGGGVKGGIREKVSLFRF